MKEKRNIYIIGTERSGTNLLRLILNSHPNIFIPHPPHIMKYLFKYEKTYGDLREDKNFEKLIEDTIKLIKYHHNPWKIKINSRDVIEIIKERNVLNIFFAAYDLYLEASGKRRWGCKSTFMINHVNSVLNYRPDSQFILMVRDPRDVCLSARKSIFSNYSPFYMAKRWSREQKTGIEFLNRFDGHTVFLLRYEDLIRYPEKSVRSLCGFLQEDYGAYLMDYFNTEEAKATGHICKDWKNVSMPFIAENVNKYLKEMKKEERILVENITIEEMKYFNYPLSSDFFRADINFKLKYFFEELALAFIAQLKHLRSDKNNILRLKKYLLVKKICILNKFR